MYIKNFHKVEAIKFTNTPLMKGVLNFRWFFFRKDIKTKQAHMNIIYE